MSSAACVSICVLGYPEKQVVFLVEGKRAALQKDVLVEVGAEHIGLQDVISSSTLVTTGILDELVGKLGDIARKGCLRYLALVGHQAQLADLVLGR